MTGRRLGVLLVLAAVTLDAGACYALAGALGARNDLFPRWLATRLWLTTGQDLYSPATDEAIRAAMGAPPLGGEAFVFGFVYPAYVALALAPLAVLPFRFAATIWLLLIQGSVVGGALLVWRAHERERALVAASPLPALAVAALLPATVMNVLFLQFSAPAFLGLAGAWWLLAHGRQGAGGVALALALIKPQLALLPAVAALARAAAEGKRRFLFAVGGIVAVVGAVSFALFPAWAGRFAASAQVYASEARAASAATQLGQMLAPSRALGIAISVAVLAMVALRWWRAGRLLGDGLMAVALLTVWLVPPLYEWNNVLLLAVLVPALRALRTKSERACWLGCAALVVLSALTLWSYTWAPSESRVIWPLMVLAVYLSGIVSRLGSQSVTSSAPSPSRPAGV